MKRTVIHLGNRTERHLLSGSIFPIDRRLERRGGNIYLERNFIRHPEIAGCRSILIPAQHLWVMFFEGHSQPHPLKCYMHMARILDGGDTVTVEDLYLDVIITRDGQWHLLDVDEFRAAIAAGELSSEQVQAALLGLENACQIVHRSGSDVEPYLHRVLAAAGA
jgi:predicted RNA-binding protein associated with RNAse of E/G family